MLYFSDWQHILLCWNSALCCINTDITNATTCLHVKQIDGEGLQKSSKLLSQQMSE